VAEPTYKDFPVGTRVEWDTQGYGTRNRLRGEVIYSGQVKAWGSRSLSSHAPPPSLPKEVADAKSRCRFDKIGRPDGGGVVVRVEQYHTRTGKKIKPLYYSPLLFHLRKVK